MNRLRGTRVDASHFCKLRVILLLPKASGEGSEDGSTYLLPSTPPTSCSPPSPPSSAPATNVGGGLGQQDLRAAGLSSKGTYDCEFPPKLSVEQIKSNLFSTIPALFPLSRNSFYLALAKDMILYDEEKRMVASHEVVSEKFMNKERITVFLLPKDECPPPPQQESGSLLEEKEMERLAKEIESEEQLWSPRETLNDDSGLNTPPLIGSRNNPRARSRLKASLGSSNTAAGSVAAAVVTSKTDKAEKHRRGSVFRRWKNRDDKKNSERLTNEYADRYMSTSRSYDDLAGKVNRQPSFDGEVLSRERSVDDLLAQDKQGDVFMSGYLVKQGGNRKNWKKRFCILTADSISYYAKKKDPTPIASIPLDEILAIARESRISREHCFALHTRRRTYFMCAPNEEDLLSWMQATKLQLIERRKVMAEEEESTESGFEGWLTVWVVVGPENANLGRGFSLRGRWKRYWCFISNTDHCLYYGKDPSTKDKREGQFPLQGVTVEFSQQRRFCFSLKSQQKALLLSADTEREMEEWMSAISCRRLIRPTYETQKSVAALPLPLPFVPVAEQPVNWDGRKTVHLQINVPRGSLLKFDRLVTVQIASVLDVLSRVPSDEADVTFFRRMALLLQKEARLYDTLMINHFLPARLVPSVLVAATATSEALNSTSSTVSSLPLPLSTESQPVPSPASSLSIHSSRSALVGGGLTYTPIPSSASATPGMAASAASSLLARQNSLPNLKRTGSGPLSPAQELIEQSVAPGGTSSSSPLGVSSTAVRTFGRKLNLYFHFYDDELAVEIERSADASSSSSLTAVAETNDNTLENHKEPKLSRSVENRGSKKATNLTFNSVDAVPTRREPDRTFGISSFNSEARINRPLPPDPSLSIESTVQALKYQGSGRKSIEVINAEVSGGTENGEIKPSQLDQSSPRSPHNSPEPTPTNGTPTVPPLESTPSLARRGFGARRSNNMLSASYRTFSPHTKLSLAISPDSTIIQAISEVMTKYYRIYKKKQKSGDSSGEDDRVDLEGWILQIKGRREYVFEVYDTIICQLAYVVSCLERWEKVEFVLRKKAILTQTIEEKHKYYQLQKQPKTPRTRKRQAGLWKNNGSVIVDEEACPYVDPTQQEPTPEISREIGEPNDCGASNPVPGEDGEKDKPKDDASKEFEPPSLEVVEQQCYDVEGLGDVPLILKILGVEHQADLFDVNPNMLVAVECGLYYGPMQLGIYRTERVRKASWSDRPQVFHTHLPLSHIPKETRICFRLIAYQGKEEWAIAWGNVALFDYGGRFLTGNFDVSLWEGERPSLMAPCVPNSTIALGTAFKIRAQSISTPSQMPIAYTRPYTAPNSPASSLMPGSSLASMAGIAAIPPAQSFTSDSASSSSSSQAVPVVSPTPVSSLRLRQLLSPSDMSPSSSEFSDTFISSAAGSSPSEPRLRQRDTVTLDPLRSVSFDEEDFIDHEMQLLKQVISKDIFYEPNSEEKRILWKYRDVCIREHPRSLAKLLLSTDWLDRNAIAQLYDLLDDWTELGPMDALELLDARFPDEQVRAFACRCLESLSDEQLASYVPQLVQALKYDSHHYSALSQFLLSRALRSRLIVGQRLFWEIKVAIQTERLGQTKWDPSAPASGTGPDDKEVRGSGGEAMALRYGLIAEAYLHGIGPQHREELLKQVFVTEELRALSHALKKIPKNKRDAFLKYKLTHLPFPKDGITMPSDPRIQVKGFLVDKCKALDSFTVPLRLVFENKEQVGDAVTIIYKAGDDLRQDALTLQLIRAMDALWKDKGLDLRLTTYGVMATGEKEGIIEAVLNSTTVAEIAKEAGGATAVFNPQTIANWLKQQNPDESKYAMAVENFLYSCAGYCVACYIIGIGDRHNDNIMVTKTGHMFHIDFAHFLGNVLKFGPIVRDKAPFVLTPEMVYVMGGRESQQFQKFIRLCCRAYNIVRSHANVFTNLFAMMISSGIPQLSSKNDMNHLAKALATEMTEEEAAKNFTALIYKSLDTKTTQLNFAVHILAHRD